MEHLWAAWRMAYIRDAVEGASEPGECIFCELPKADDDSSALILTRGSKNFMLLNAFPYNSGHTMVAPFRHVGTVEDLDHDEAVELFAMVQQAAAGLRDAYHPEGMNIGMNIGRIAGAGFPGHLHMHLVPRWSGDTNFMPVLGDTRVIPESLPATYDRLRTSLEDANDA